MAYLTTPQEARVCFNAMSKDLAFVGHTHVAEYYRTSGEGQLPEEISLWSGGPVDLEAGMRYIVNPGAIGQPRDSNPLASFATWDSERNRVEVRRVAYDMAQAQEKMERAGLPDYLIERLAVGR
jgi:diadenosine tetraphosphatase ApaH/serine/threonine PP2A family protein phosphatase